MTYKEIICAEIEKLRKEYDIDTTPIAKYQIAQAILNRLSDIIDSLSEEPVKIDRQVSKMADEFAEREYETNGYERLWLSKGYYHGYMDAKIKASEWISKHAIKYYLDGSKYLGTDELVEDLKIAMTL